jgi:transcriptional regulator with XRE-family HTH domain
MSRSEEFVRDSRYAHSYLEELQDLQLAAQIRVLREQRGWTQEELAARAGMKQARVSLLESGEYSGFTLATLRKLSRAFDVCLRVIFAPFSRTTSELEERTRERMKVVPRAEELATIASTNSKVVQFDTALKVKTLQGCVRYNADPASDRSISAVR